MTVFTGLQERENRFTWILNWVSSDSAEWQTGIFENAPKAGVKVVAAHDIDPARLEDARNLGLKAYEKLRDFLADPEINAVLVATPNQVHKELSIAALRAGKHVIVEKPADAFGQGLGRNGGGKPECRQNSYGAPEPPLGQGLPGDARVIEDGGLGRVAAIESRVFGTGGALFGWRGFKQYGGGMLLDWGVHLIDQFLDMYPDKKVKSVYARLMNLRGQEVDDYDKVFLSLEGGPLLHMEICTFAFRNMPRWYVIGDGGTLIVDDFESNGGYTKPRITDTPIAPVVVMTAAGPTRMMAPRPPETKEDFPLPSVEWGWIDFYKNLTNVINGQAELVVKPEQVRRVLQVLEAIFRSANDGKSIDVSL